MTAPVRYRGRFTAFTALGVDGVGSFNREVQYRPSIQYTTVGIVSGPQYNVVEIVGDLQSARVCWKSGFFQTGRYSTDPAFSTLTYSFIHFNHQGRYQRKVPHIHSG